jgi:hypothetical protein
VLVSGLRVHLVDIDEQPLSAARAELGTDTIKATVNESIRLAATNRDPRVVEALDLLAGAPTLDTERTLPHISASRSCDDRHRSDIIGSCRGEESWCVSSVSAADPVASSPRSC